MPIGPRLASALAALPEGAPRVWTQSLPITAQTNARPATATSAARRPISKAGFAPAPALRLSPTPAALPEGVPRVWTQSLPRNAMRPATAVSGDGAARPRIAGSRFQSKSPFAVPFPRLFRLWSLSAHTHSLTRM